MAPGESEAEAASVLAADLAAWHGRGDGGEVQGGRTRALRARVGAHLAVAASARVSVPVLSEATLSDVRTGWRTELGRGGIRSDRSRGKTRPQTETRPATSSICHLLRARGQNESVTTVWVFVVILFVLVIALFFFVSRR